MKHARFTARCVTRQRPPGIAAAEWREVNAQYAQGAARVAWMESGRPVDSDNATEELRLDALARYGAAMALLTRVVI